ncbi:prokineticin receptor 2-like [Branchiostoma lanceolatum]
MDENVTEIDLSELYDDIYYMLEQEGHTKAHSAEHASITLRVILGLVYSLIIIICGIGNLLLVIVMGRYKKARTTTNLLIANLALSDFVVAVLCIPFDLDYYIINERAWNYGPHMCRLVNYVKMVSLYVSTDALLVIGVDRYMMILHPSRQRMGRKSAILVSVGVWVFSMLIAIPSAKFSKIQPYSNETQFFCGVVWDVQVETASKWYFGSMLVFQFILPVVIMAFCYLAVVWQVFHREPPGVVTDAHRSTLQRSKKKTLRLVAMLVMFVLCWAPYYICTAIRDFHDLLNNNPMNTNIFYAVEATAMGNSAINTCVYVAFNGNVIQYVTKFVQECFRTPKNNEGTMVTFRSRHAAEHATNVTTTEFPLSNTI